MLTAIDAILLGTVLLVIGYGLYELFVDADIHVPAWLRVTIVDDLKSKLIGVGAGALVAGLALFSFATRADAAVAPKRGDSATSPPAE